MQHDWSTFRLRVPIHADIARLYKAWSTSETLESWFLRKADFTTKDGIKRERDRAIQVSDTYLWLWHGYNDEAVEKGIIMQANGKDLLQFSFGKAGNVTVTIKQEAGEGLVELVQTDIPADEEGLINYYLGCSKGWLFYLANLKSILEGGIDLRNKKVELTDVINS